MQIAIIGAGHLGKALLRGLLEDGSATRLRASCQSTETLRILRDDLGVAATLDNAECVAGADIVLLALLPADLEQAAASLQGRLGEARAVVSVMGYVPLGHLARALGTDQIARALPSLSVAERRGLTVWSASPLLREEGRAVTRDLLRSLGDEHHVDDERLVDLSAPGGPCAVAYYLEILSALVAATERLGYTAEVARRLVHGGFIGTAAMLEHRAPSSHPETREVGHSGSATDRALSILSEARLGETLGRAVAAAATRTVEISSIYDDSPFARARRP